ncbi:MAG: glycyl-radical enzyme activating protein [Denitrovibrio sp.]|nr:MAG: glycyl-radical enzyme activating protein [Denitrovibrio sp.]
MKDINLKGIVFDIKHYAIHDGDGIRTTVFFKGCPLSCIWCHNPESRKPSIQTIKKELKLDGKSFCTDETVGKEMTVSEVMDEIKKDLIFYEESGGGATFSGGEVFLQDKFLISLLEECQKSDINTCIDTTGFVSEGTLRSVIPLADSFLFDVKLIDDEAHVKYCGVSNKKILDNFRFIYANGKNIRLRLPVIPGITDTAQNLKLTAQFAKQFDGVEIDLLPYHKIGKDKYRKLGMDYKMDGVESPSNDRMEELVRFFEGYEITTTIGG